MKANNNQIIGIRKMFISITGIKKRLPLLKNMTGTATKEI